MCAHPWKACWLSSVHRALIIDRANSPPHEFGQTAQKLHASLVVFDSCEIQEEERGSLKTRND